MAHSAPDNRLYGFVGLGNMGTPMSLRLLEAGHRVVVYDPRAAAMDALVARGATSAASLKDLADQAEVVFMSLPMPDVVRQVAIGDGGLIEGTTARVVVDLSTTGPGVTGQVAQALTGAGKVLIDCPVSGGAAGAGKGSLALMVAGEDAAIDDIEPVLQVFGKVFRVGLTPGQGQMMKLINNLMSSAALTIASETMVLGVKAGLDADKMIEVLNSGSGANSATGNKIPKFVLPRTFDFGFALGLSAKDARLCLEEGDKLGVPMIVGTAVKTLLTIGRDHLGAEADMTEVVRVVEQWAGVEVKGAAAG
ncbi:MAG: oxidoreductase [Rhodobacteraceae bacterium]|nr:oxidoreductase [Paracoccaceae bacterium]MAY48007.1 oxidoreductase [Paracoccaceae bacterium]QEW24087.1 2-(hydroxymethyl)glutarate dehydrogenase [Paracoccaceae bacterium]